MQNITLGYAITGSFCTIRESINSLKALSEYDMKILPIMSETAYSTDTRFGKAEDIVKSNYFSHISPTLSP